MVADGLWRCLSVVSPRCSAEEKQLLRGYGGQPEGLGSAEQFMLEVGGQDLVKFCPALGQHAASNEGRASCIISVLHTCLPFFSLLHLPQMMQLPGLEQGLEALPFSSGFAARAEAVEAAASLLSRACQEVRHSDMLRTLLKVAMLAGEQAAALLGGRHAMVHSWKGSLRQ